ncbi:serine/threonine-protein kinase [Actinoallomurus sp. NPDC052308]|uniref:serine/threonine-protein kinase n=1 Tax=Actinoallomurus sp. NPDC052308 TaxID=3155530 RepID=UPI003439256D
MIGGHRLAGRLASGGTSIVYLARDDHGSLVAVKTARGPKAGQAQVRHRLRTEAACARRLPSSCTARLLVDGTDQTRPYLIREYVEGPSLKQFVEDVGPLEPAQVAALAKAVAKALAAVHRAGVIHGDLGPAHVLLAADGPRLIDFSIAQEIPGSGKPAQTGAADNPEHAASERATGGPAAPASDILGWGCLVGYAATGRSPFADADEAGRPPVPQPTLPSAWGDPLRGLVDAALAEDPADRPTADDLVLRLNTADRPAIAPPPEPATTILAAPGPATGTATPPDQAPGPEAGTDLPTAARRPRWATALFMASVPIAAALAAVIVFTGEDANHHMPLGPGRTTAPRGQETTDSHPHASQGAGSSRPDGHQPVTVVGAHDTADSPTSDRSGEHGGRVRRNKADKASRPSGPGGSSAPGSSHVPSVSSPAAPSSPAATPTPSPTASPTTTETR